MATCAVEGGCPTDYIALVIATLSFILLLIRSSLPFLVQKAPHTKRSGFWLPVIQVFASFNFLISITLSANFLKFQRRHWLLSCYIWAVWFEGPLGFGLLMSCRIAQAFQLYYIFVKRRLPPLKSHVFLPLILLLWIAVAALIQVRKPLNSRCHMGTQWVIPVICLHMLYVSGLVAFTAVIRHVEFKFDELKELLRGIFVAASSIGMWIFAYILNEVHEEISWLQVASRFSLLMIASVLVLVFFSLSSSQPLLSQISLRRNEPLRFETMGQALGIPDSGLLLHREPAVAIDPKEPLDKLLLNRKFRQSFMAFADSCLAGESVHFFEEVHELGKIPSDDPVRRIYMARHIIDKYVISGAAMEVNISHKTRQEILTTNDLADCGLFDKALNELTQLMKMNLAKDYWSSIYFMKFKEASASSHNHGLADWDLPSRLSVVKATDDPFSQDHFSKGSSNGSPGMNP